MLMYLFICMCQKIDAMSEMNELHWTLMVVLSHHEHHVYVHLNVKRLDRIFKLLVFSITT